MSRSLVGFLLGDWECFFCGSINALLDGECQQCFRLRVSPPPVIRRKKKAP